MCVFCCCLIFIFWYALPGIGCLHSTQPIYTQKVTHARFQFFICFFCRYQFFSLFFLFVGLTVVVAAVISLRFFSRSVPYLMLTQTRSIVGTNRCRFSVVATVSFYFTFCSAINSHYDNKMN